MPSLPKRATKTLALAILASFTATAAFSSTRTFLSQRVCPSPRQAVLLAAVEENNSKQRQATEIQSSSTAPVLNGKRVLPFKVIMAGLNGHKVAGVYAVLNSKYKRGYAGWESCEFVGVSMDMGESLQRHLDDHGPEIVAHIRALSFVVPSQGAMNEVAEEWRRDARAAGRIVLSSFDKDAVLAAIEAAIPFDDDDEDDDEDDDDEDFVAMRAEALTKASDVTSESSSSEAVVSPFEESGAVSSSGTTVMEFTKENVDKVLDEVRPYLISDGGNVSVDRVDEEKKDVYLVLEGACGSCPSSTVTMQMGIERVLKENFADLNQVLQVEETEDKATELTLEAVESEVNRIKQAIIAMGGFVKVASVDPSAGVVEVEFRGGSKLQKGVELAIRDVEFVKEIQFIEPSI